MSDPLIGRVRFVDGAERDVYRAPDGRQYDLDDGEPVYGVWLLTVVAEAAAAAILSATSPRVDDERRSGGASRPAAAGSAEFYFLSVRRMVTASPISIR
jgi:hypothetical protein